MDADRRDLSVLHPDAGEIGALVRARARRDPLVPKRCHKRAFEASHVGDHVIDPDDRIVTVYTAPEQFTVLEEDQLLDGGAVLPGFTLPLRELFAEWLTKGFP